MKIRIETYHLVLLLGLLGGTICPGKPALAQEQPFKLERAPFSDRKYDAYSPVFYDGGIVFRSNKRLNVMKKSSDRAGNTAMNLFFVRDLGDGNWSQPELFSGSLSGIKQHFGPATFNAEGDRIWFNKINEDSPKDQGRIGIYSVPVSVDRVPHAHVIDVIFILQLIDDRFESARKSRTVRVE